MTFPNSKKPDSTADAQSIFLVFFALSIASNFIFPIWQVVAAPLTYLGFLPLALGLAISLLARSLFVEKETTLSPRGYPTALLTDGLYRFSRNPIYLGMAAILFGTAIVLGSLAPFASPLLFVLIVDRTVIPIEEKKLEKIFGRSYLEYKNNVGRWI